MLHLMNRVVMRRVALLFGVLAGILLLSTWLTPAGAAVGPKVFLPSVRGYSVKPTVPIVFVSRQILGDGSIYYDPGKDMPGVGPHSRFRNASPGKLMILEPNGATRVLVDGSNPRSASLYLIDVNAPDVSYDGKKIVFAGLPNGNHSKSPNRNPGAWRLYSINVNGSGLRQLTFSDLRLDLSQFGAAKGGLATYDDTDPVWLPDGRIVFSSTRWPSYGQYSGARATNLHVVNADGSKPHRITAERNGAERPLVDPITGKIVYARWWRNHRFPVNSMDTVTDPNGGYKQKDGVTADRNDPVGGPTMFRNAWQASEINPDGTEVAMWSGTFRDEEANHTYGGAFSANGTLYANFFPMYNMTEAGGYGGIRRYTRGAGRYTPVIGITGLSINYVGGTGPGDYSYGVYKGSYAADPDVLPDGRLILSWAKDTNQDYGIYVISPDGSLVKLYDNPGTTELRARLVQPRSLPPVIADKVTQVPSLLPPTSDPNTFRKDGTFVFDALNIYANAPVDSDIVNAPAVGSAGKIRFFIDHQRTSPGSFPNLDWPILLGELAVSAAGEVTEPNAPANVPLFEQLRAPDGSVPLTRGPRGDEGGAAHVAGMNFGRPGTTVRCVGCHANHSMMSVPTNRSDAKWTNLATGATIEVSSSRDPKYNKGLNDRRVMKGEIWRYWTSSGNDTTSQDAQWAKLSFPVPITVRSVRLYNPRQGDEANSSIQVRSALVRLYNAAGTEIASKSVSDLSVFGTDVSFADVAGVVSVRVELTDVSGTFYGARCASLAEIEVIGHG